VGPCMGGLGAKSPEARKHDINFECISPLLFLNPHISSLDFQTVAT